jgi:hypothetical protein
MTIHIPQVRAFEVSTIAETMVLGWGTGARLAYPSNQNFQAPKCANDRPKANTVFTDSVAYRNIGSLQELAMKAKTRAQSEMPAFPIPVVSELVLTSASVAAKDHAVTHTETRVGLQAVRRAWTS